MKFVSLNFVRVLNFLILVYSTPLLAGWAGGGGEFLEDLHNPWFLSNTREVHYCILIDEENFGVSRSQAKAIFEGVVNLWSREINLLVPKRVTPPNKTSPEIDLLPRTTIFVEVKDCDANVDLTLQLGVLLPEQEKQIEDATRFASIAIRTSYDTTNLKGRGFIYVAPEIGRLHIPGLAIARPWNYGGNSLLKALLMHELGHVYGFKHNEDSWLMTSNIAQKLKDPNEVDRLNVDMYALELGHKFLFGPEKSRIDTIDFQSEMGIKVNIKDLWGLPSGHLRVRSRIENNVLTISSAPINSQDFKIAGTAKLEGSDDFTWSNIGTVWLPASQNPFRALGLNRYVSIAFEPAFHIFNGSYKSLNGKANRQIKYSERLKMLGGEYKGKFYYSFAMEN